MQIGFHTPRPSRRISESPNWPEAIQVGAFRFRSFLLCVAAGLLSRLPMSSYFAGKKI